MRTKKQIQQDSDLFNQLIKEIESENFGFEQVKNTIGQFVNFWAIQDDQNKLDTIEVFKAACKNNRGDLAKYLVDNFLIDPDYVVRCKNEMDKLVDKNIKASEAVKIKKLIEDKANEITKLRQKLPANSKKKLKEKLNEFIKNKKLVSSSDFEELFSETIRNSLDENPSLKKFIQSGMKLLAEETSKEIIDKTLDINQLIDGKTLLVQAVQMKDPGLVEYILNRNPNLDMEYTVSPHANAEVKIDSFIVFANNTEIKELIEAKLKDNATKKQDRELAQQLIKKIENYTKSLIKDNNMLDEMKHDISKIKDINQVVDNAGNTILMHIVAKSSNNILRYILSNRLDIDFAAKNNDGKDIFEFASQWNIDILLIKKLLILTSSDNYDKNQAKDIIKEIKYINELDDNGRTLLMKACVDGSIGLVKQLLEIRCKDIKIQLKDKNGKDAKSLAKDSLQTLKALDDFEKKREKESKEKILCIVSREVSVRSENIRTFDDFNVDFLGNKNNPIYCVLEREGIIEFEKEEVDKLTKQAIENRNKVTLLTDALKDKEVTIEKLKIIIAQGLDLNKCDRKCKLPLNIAIRDVPEAKRLEIIKFLLDSGANPNVEEYSTYQNTVDLAIYNNYYDIIELFVDKYPNFTENQLYSLRSQKEKVVPESREIIGRIISKIPIVRTNESAGVPTKISSEESVKQLDQYLKSDDIKNFKKLWDEGNNELTAKQKSDLLFAAITRTHSIYHHSDIAEKIAIMIVEKSDKDVLDCKEILGRTALMLALSNGTIDLSIILFDKDSEIDIKAVDESKQTILHHLTERMGSIDKKNLEKCIGLLQKIIDKCDDSDLTAKDKYGHTALSYLEHTDYRIIDKKIVKLKKEIPVDKNSSNSPIRSRTEKNLSRSKTASNNSSISAGNSKNESVPFDKQKDEIQPGFLARQKGKIAGSIAGALFGAGVVIVGTIFAAGLSPAAAFALGALATMMTSAANIGVTTQAFMAGCASLFSFSTIMGAFLGDKTVQSEIKTSESVKEKVAKKEFSYVEMEASRCKNSNSLRK